MNWATLIKCLIVLFSCSYSAVNHSEKQGHQKVFGWTLCVWKNNSCTRRWI